MITENFDIMLDTFPHNTLEKQVDDVLSFPYKFTRVVTGKRVIIGIKQETTIKLNQCIQEVEGDVFICFEKK